MNAIEQTNLAADVRQILAEHGKMSVEGLQDADDLYKAGLTSLATVAVMLALEDRFNVEFPESMLGRRTFKSIESIAEAISELSA